MQTEDLKVIRQDFSSMLQRSVPNQVYSKSMKNLRNKPDLTILRADKGNATVVMDPSNCNSKIQELYSNVSTYKKFENDPTNNTLKTTSDLVKKLEANNY